MNAIYFCYIYNILTYDTFKYPWCKGKSYAPFFCSCAIALSKSFIPIFNRHHVTPAVLFCHLIQSRARKVEPIVCSTNQPSEKYGHVVVQMQMLEYFCDLVEITRKKIFSVVSHPLASLFWSYHRKYFGILKAVIILRCQKSARSVKISLKSRRIKNLALAQQNCGPLRLLLLVLLVR